VLGDWMQYGNSTANVATVRSLLGQVTYNSEYNNTLQAGSGLDWFWATFHGDKVNNKKGDLLG
jgi:hypothetical protein